jgi:hypothetical protein
MGYLTSPMDGDGRDGLLSLIVGVVVVAGGLHYFFMRNVWGSLGLVVLGLGIAALGTYNMTRLIYEAKRDLNISTSTAFDLIGTGLYLTIVGGGLTVVGAFMGAWRSVGR